MAFFGEKVVGVIGSSEGDGSGEMSMSDSERLRLVLRDSKKASF